MTTANETTQPADEGRLEPTVGHQWKPASELPPRWKHGPGGVVVLAIAETDDGGMQMTTARVVAMSKADWREVRFDHAGMGRRLFVRCWTELPAWPNPVPCAAW